MKIPDRDNGGVIVWLGFDSLSLCRLQADHDFEVGELGVLFNPSHEFVVDILIDNDQIVLTS